MKFQIELPIPPTLNEQINMARSHWSKSAKAKKQWGNYFVGKLKDAPSFDGEVWQQFTWFVSFKNDPDNVAGSLKYINDALVKAGVMKNDNLAVIQSPILHHYVKKVKGQDPSVLVEISDEPFSISRELPETARAIATEFATSDCPF